MPPPELSNQPLAERLNEALPEALAVGKEHRGELTLEVAPAAWRRVAQWLKSEAGFDLFCDLTCVDWLPARPRFAVVAQLYATSRHEWLRIETRVDEDHPPLSLVPVWPAANWFEREVFDLFGIRFEEHPDLRRLLMPEGWSGYPLRKDYPVEGYR